MLERKEKPAKKACLIALCTITCAFATGLGVQALSSGLGAVSAEECEIIVENEWKEEYKLNDTFIIPDALISYNDKEYTPDYQYLQYPDGNIVDYEVYSLNYLGTYSVIYEANVGSKKLTAVKSFSVLSEAYTAKDATYEYRDKLNMSEASEKSGLGVMFSNGGDFHFNLPVNVKKFSKNEPIAIVYPYNRTMLGGNNGSVTEARKITVRLTDCYDENTYVDIVLSWDVTNVVTGNRHPYFRAGASNQATIGLEESSPSPNTRSVWLNGVHYRAFDNDKFGASSKDWSAQSADNFGYSIFYDDERKEIYVQDRAGTYFVNDLDETLIYDQNVFTGFTTGDVYISIFGEDYYTSTMNVEIEKLGQYQTSDFAVLKEVKDEEKPFIKIAADTTETIYIAKDGEFKIFEADYRDFNKGKPISACVYYNYGTENQVQIPIKNGKIKPTKNGLYTIEYVAEDVYGNRSVETVDLKCVDGFDGKTVLLKTEQLSSLSGGYECELPEYELTGVNNGKYIRMYVVYGGKEVEIDSDSRKLFVDELGTYKIVYRYGDKYYDYEYSYDVISGSSDAIVLEQPTLPLHFIKDAPYSLDAGTAYIYSGTSVVKEKITDVYVKQGKGEFVKLTDVENVKFTESGTVQFRYNYGTVELCSSEIPVVDVGFTGVLDLKNYFYGDDFEKQSSPSCISYYSKKTGCDNALQFINAIGLSNFSLKFRVPTDYDKFTSLTIQLCDYYNRENKVELVYGKSEVGVYFGVQGGESQTLKKDYAGETWTVSYSEKLKCFNIGSNISLHWASTFVSDRVLLQITLNDITAESGIEIMQVNNQIFSGNITKDNIRPVIKTDVQGEYQLGSIISVAPATATDVISPFFKKNFTFEVVDPSGNTVISTDGVTLDNNCDKTRSYEFMLEEYGVYYVSYRYSDYAGKRMDIDIPLQVIEDVAPTITLGEGLNEMSVRKVAYNSTVEVASFTVTDNQTPTEKLKAYVIVRSPKGELILLDETNKFVAERKGIYVVYYYCIDEAGNMSLRFYNIEVI